MNVHIIRNQVLKNLRECLSRREYIETSSPIIRSCDSKINPRFALTDGRFLRDCMELPLRQRALRACPKVFEIGPCFRKDKEDETHFHEFYMMELYSVGESLKDMITLMSSIVTSCMPVVKNIKEVSVREFILNDVGVDIFLEDTGVLVKAILAKHTKLQVNKAHPYITVNKYIEAFIESTLTERDCLYFLTDYPLCTIAVAKRKGGGNCIERFECFINGMEVSNAFEDCTDPNDLEKRLNASGIMGMEEELLVSLTRSGDLQETVGLGIGIDRLCLLTTKK